ncbi:MAG TPA: AHH domain-containing protein [Longimicrobiales bacterium]|nr:AHH domain-containing protein [Longimicrobiales bacterium]
MAELGEMISAAAAVDEWKCPFPHRPVKHDKTNVLPPPKTKNDATKLSNSLDTESKHLENIDISFTCRKKAYDLEAQFTAHHLIPGNESWPASKNRLRKWVDKGEKWIKGDIGYDVNSARNGVDLPGHSAAPSWTDQQFQTAYAFNCMTADRKERQFHDRHPAYSDFVVNVLNKIATKLETFRSQDGCGKEDCGGAGKKKYDPPYGLIDRLNGVAVRLERHLIGTCKRWKKPVMTSRFALMYKNRGLTQAQARAQLRKNQFKY